MRFLLVHLMILLFLWQVGACPCGCLDHNAWVEVVFEDGGSESTESLRASSLPKGGEAGSPHHCEGQSRPQYLRELRESELRSRLPSARTHFEPAGVFRNFCDSGTAGRRGWPFLPDVASSRGPTRDQAVLQVWLI